MSTTTRILLFLCIFCCIPFSAFAKHSDAIEWLDANTEFFHQKILANLSPADGLPGAVIAARKVEHEPDYHYHWVRDAGITMIALNDRYQSLPDGHNKQQLRHAFFDYLDFSARIQNTNKLTDLGEPKFYVNGEAYFHPWGRPQNDGPALRAISLIHWANNLLAEGDEAIVRHRLYDAALPATLPIKKDLEYLSHHWREPSFDIWEEVQGTHFYTLMVIRRALLEGAILARRLDDQGAAEWYHSQAKQVELAIQSFWNEEKGYLTATINRVSGIDYKQSNLDSAVLLGLLHGGMDDGFLAWDNPKVIATLRKLRATFAALYPVNQDKTPGVAIGRYPEDRYGGNDFTGGNPWPLCTLAMAEASYAYAALLQRHQQPYASIIHQANSDVKRARHHAHPDGSMDEQIDRDSGEMKSARDLTWNYAALLTTHQRTLVFQQ